MKRAVKPIHDKQEEGGASPSQSPSPFSSMHLSLSLRPPPVSGAQGRYGGSTGGGRAGQAEGAGGGLVDFVLEDVEVVGGGHGDDVLLGVPGGVQDLLAEVQAVHADLVLATLAPDTHLGEQRTAGITSRTRWLTPGDTPGG